MGSIEVITSKEKSVLVTTESGEKKTFHVRVWNGTIANLTLMALGSSAPEILLSVIETFVLNEMHSGALGPSTIVGSAAFNLMVITAVCVVCLPAGETRTLKQLGVFLTTSFWSLWAYIWLIIIVMVSSPQRIDVWEGVMTIVFFMILLAQAYLADQYWDKMTTKKYTSMGVDGMSKTDAAEAMR